MPLADVAASFQEAVADVLTAKAVRACREHGVDHLVLGGGVAANSRLRALAEERCAAAGIVLRVPSPKLCTDNGAMVAALGSRLVAAGVAPSAPDLGADSSLPIDVVSRAERLADQDGRGAGHAGDHDDGGVAPGPSQLPGQGLRFDR